MCVWALKAVWNHWAVKNRLHWVLDVQMQEDDFRNRMGHGPLNLAGIRCLIVNFLCFDCDIAFPSPTLAKVGETL